MTAPIPPRWNLAPDPRAVTPATGPYGGADGWMSSRGFGTGATGTYDWLTGDPNPAPPGITTLRRKYWGTGMSASGNLSGTGLELRAGAALYFDTRNWQGRKVTASLYARCAGVPGTGLQLAAVFYASTAAGSAQVGPTLYGPVVPYNAGWTFCRPWGSFTVPAGAAGLRILVDPVGTGQIAAGSLIDYTGELIEPDTSAAGTYFDGSTADQASLGYSWTGVQNASPSVASVAQVGAGGSVYATCEVWVDGIRLADGAGTAELPTAPFVLTGLSVRWGRENTLDQCTPSQCTFKVADPAGSPRFDSQLRLGATVLIWSQVYTSRVCVFAGRITDLDVLFSDETGYPEITVAAADLMADLANRFVGTEPWPAEALWQRAQRIFTACGVSVQISPAIPSPPAVLTVSKMDVDRQAGAGLLNDLATTGGMVLTTGWDEKLGSQLRWEDPNTRTGQTRFVLNGSTGKWGPSAAAGGAVLDADELDRDPTHWVRDGTDLLTRVTVRWLDQATNPPTERSVLASDAASEATFGARGVSIGTVLVSSGDAQNRANAVLAGHPPSVLWRLAGLTWTLEDAASSVSGNRSLAVSLLNSMTRGGLAVQLVDLPDWTPTNVDLGLYVEGGTYTFRAGSWDLSLLTVSPTGQGHSMTFDETNRAVRYLDVDPAVTYLGMIGVSA